MSDRVVCVSVRVPLDEAEEARAIALDLVPGGFAEFEDSETLTLALYVGEIAVDSIRAVFSDVTVSPVSPGWEHTWRAFHRPVRAGGLWIGAPWEQPDPGELSVVIDPGLAFGTGAHATTRLCIELLAKSPRGSLLDIGCGSGVLSIAASRLGFDPIRAVDNDPVAVETAIANAHANGVEIEASVLDGELDALPSAELVVANVLLAPVERILGRLEARAAITWDTRRPTTRSHGVGRASPGSSWTAGPRIASSGARASLRRGNRHDGIVETDCPGAEDVCPKAAAVYESREHARRSKSLQVRARLREAAADAFDLADAEVMPDERIEPDAAGDDVPTGILPCDLDAGRRECVERLDLDQRQLIAATGSRERSCPVRIAIALETSPGDCVRLGHTVQMCLG